MITDANTFQIDNLHLRIPGLTPQEAHQLAHEAAQRLAGRLPERMTALHLGALDLRLTVPWGTPRSRVADLIVEAILKRIT
jgi:hypothetical protein